MRGDWDNVVEETYEVAKELVGRSIAFDRILSRCLGVLGNYQVNRILPRHHFFRGYQSIPGNPDVEEVPSSMAPPRLEWKLP